MTAENVRRDPARRHDWAPGKLLLRHRRTSSRLRGGRVRSQSTAPARGAEAVPSIVALNIERRTAALAFVNIEPREPLEPKRPSLGAKFFRHQSSEKSTLSMYQWWISASQSATQF